MEIAMRQSTTGADGRWPFLAAKLLRSCDSGESGHPGDGDLHPAESGRGGARERFPSVSAVRIDGTCETSTRAAASNRNGLPDAGGASERREGQAPPLRRDRSPMSRREGTYDVVVVGGGRAGLVTAAGIAGPV